MFRYFFDTIIIVSTGCNLSNHIKCWEELETFTSHLSLCSATGVVHGGWSPWQPWGSCTRSCGSGSQTRIRTCTNPPPRNGGNNCLGANLQCRSCNSNSCPGESTLVCIKWQVSFSGHRSQKCFGTLMFAFCAPILVT